MREMTVEDLDELLKSERQKVDTYRKDIHFLSIALNLSGNRDNLEEQAKDLIDNIGYIKAIKESSLKQKEDFANVIPKNYGGK